MASFGVLSNNEAHVLNSGLLWPEAWPSRSKHDLTNLAIEVGGGNKSTAKYFELNSLGFGDLCRSKHRRVSNPILEGMIDLSRD